jgi:hypothetical protein
MTRLLPWGEDLWLAEGPVVSFFGFRYPTRMAVIRLSDGDLFIWSPIAVEPALKAEINALGKVAHLVSPNKLHHLYLRQWKDAYPSARLYAPPGLAKKRLDIRFDAALENDAPPAWAQEIDQVCFGGSPMMTEIVFFHRKSGTALFCDLIEHFPRSWFTGWRGWIARLDGIVEPDFGAPREWRMTFFGRAQARIALAHILAWQPRRVVIAHGDGVTAEGEAFIRHAFRWLA